MPRSLRIHYPNACYHVMNRGAGKKYIFKNNLHRNIFLELLAECHRMFNVKIQAYCLMDNHYHILLSTPDGNLSRVMRHLNGVYTQRYNRIMKTDGALFKGRYHAKLIEDDSYKLMVSRYIHLNPLEANMVEKAVNYKWSSYRFYHGLAKAPSWLDIDSVLRQFNTTKSLSHIDGYSHYVEEAEYSEIQTFYSTQFTGPVVGSPAFKDKILSQIDPSTSEMFAPDINRLKQTPDIESIINNICNFYKIDRESLLQTKRGILNWPRIVCIRLCRNYFGHSIKTIASAFGPVCSKTIGNAIRQGMLLSGNHARKEEIDGIYQWIRNEMFQKGSISLPTS